MSTFGYTKNIPTTLSSWAGQLKSLAAKADASKVITDKVEPVKYVMVDNQFVNELVVTSAFPASYTDVASLELTMADAEPGDVVELMFDSNISFSQTNGEWGWGFAEDGTLLSPGNFQLLDATLGGSGSTSKAARIGGHIRHVVTEAGSPVYTVQWKRISGSGVAYMAYRSMSARRYKAL